MISAPRASICAMSVGDGGAAAVEMISGRGSRSSGRRGVVRQRDQHRRRGAEVGDAFLAHEPPDRLRVELAQADVRAADGRHRPRVAPAVAVEHRQRPEVDAVGGHARLQQLAQAVEIGAAVGVEDALGTAGRAGGVIDGDRLVLVRERPIERLWTAGGQERFIVRTGQPQAARHVLDADDEFEIGQPFTIGATTGASSVSTTRTFAPECSRM